MKTFILGMGGRKAATTWVFAYLQENANFKTGITKEYSVFDRIQEIVGENGSILDFDEDSRNSLSQRHLEYFKDPIRSEMINDQSKYFDHFEQLLNGDDDSIVADMTPMHSILNTNLINFIISEFKKRQIETKLIFIVRDPLLRTFSDFKMFHKGVFGEISEKTISEDFLDYVTKYFKLEKLPDNVIETINDSIADKHKIHIEFYEKLFSSEGIKRLSRFLGMSPIYKMVSRKTNVGEKIGIDSVSLEVQRQVANMYRDTYDYFLTMDPSIKRLWYGYKLLDQ